MSKSRRNARGTADQVGLQGRPRPALLGAFAALVRSGILLACVQAALQARAFAAWPQEPEARPDEEAPHEVRSFAIPETSLARALMERAREHVAAGRWSDAVETLQTLIEEHCGVVLTGSTRADDGSWRSQMPVHLGAASEAARLLADLPPSARALYAERFGQEARVALAGARAAGDRAALTEVARRFPLTAAAREAWWALGDLELERGLAAAARAAWQRAASATERAGEALSPGALARLSYAAAPELEPARKAADESAAPPGPDAQAWRVRIEAGGRPSPFPVLPGDDYSLLPVLCGDLLLVSNSMTLRAFDAWTGRLRWESAEAPGWSDVDGGHVLNKENRPYSREDFFKAVDHKAVLIAPAAAGSVVLAGLQIPVTQIDNTRYQRIPITVVIPDRRLFAFDLESGAQLWNHMPPPGWNGESGTFPERMSVAGPPVITGSRVLVPTYRPQGRIDYHVACYDLLTGALLWSTGVISGQRELNMFGRLMLEYSAAPLVVAGETVIALTQLGAIAALDLATGDILWETLYDSMPLPPNEHHWEAVRRPQHWLNAAPIVVGEVVLATPLDSTDLCALDLRSGAMLWSLPINRLVDRGQSRERWLLLAAQEDTLWLSGSALVAWRAPGGLEGPRPPTERVQSPGFAGEGAPRPALGGHWIVAATPGRRVVFDRRNVRFEDRSLSTARDEAQEAGNALLVDGALFTLSSKYLTGAFDWAVQERRFEQALSAAADNHALSFSYVAMLLERARAAISQADHERALAHLERASAELEPRLSLPERGVARQAEAAVHTALRLQAEVLTRQADTAAALKCLERASELAPVTGELRDTLLETARLLRNRGEGDRRLEVLAELMRRCGALHLPRSTSLLDRPLSERSAPPEPGSSTIARWVLVERAREHARRSDARAELAVLHELLSAFGDVPLDPEPDGDAGSPRVGERIATLIAERGRGVYAPFEERARALYEQALSDDDPAGLEWVIDLYPQSEAAQAAARARLEQAWRAREPAVLARLVQERLPAGWCPERASREEIAALAKLGALLSAAGNLDFEAGLLRTLARDHPEERPDSPEGPALFERAARAEERAAMLAASHPSSFDAGLRSTRLFPGDHQLLGLAPRRAADEDGADVLLLAHNESRRTRTLWALSSSDPAERLWQRTASPFAGRHHLILPGSLVVSAGRGLLALDPTCDRELWARDLDNESVEALCGASGVVVAALSGSERSARLLALDAISGIELWSAPIARGLHPFAVVGPEHAVLLPREAAETQAEVRDLFTGRLSLAVGLEQDVGDADLRGAWIEESRLVVPGFPRAGAVPAAPEASLHALDLSSGRLAWRVPRAEGRELDSVVRCGRDAYLVLLSARFPGNEAGGLVQVDTRLGAQRPVSGVRLSLLDAPIGVRRSTVVELEEPDLFLLSPVPGGRESLIRAVHLPYGERWVHRLPVPADEVFNTPLPLPAQSATTVALCYTEVERSRPAQAEPRTTLLLLERATGLKRGEIILNQSLGRSDALELRGLGSALVVQGRDALAILAPE